MDDILLAYNDKKFLLKIKDWLSTTFEMNDMGEAAYVFGVKISRDWERGILALLQEPYMKDP